MCRPRQLQDHHTFFLQRSSLTHFLAIRSTQRPGSQIGFHLPTGVAAATAAAASRFFIIDSVFSLHQTLVVARFHLGLPLPT
jgi:hypothetical protein